MGRFRIGNRDVFKMFLAISVIFYYFMIGGFSLCGGKFGLARMIRSRMVRR